MKKKNKDLEPTGFNTVGACSTCSPCKCPSSKREECNDKISRHEFGNPYEFSDKALLEELIIRIKKGCIKLKHDKKGSFADDESPNEYFVYYWLEEECRWDLSRGQKLDKNNEIVEDENFKGNYVLKLSDLKDIQEEYEKLHDERKICDICLYKLKQSGTNKGMFCGDCWEKELKTRDKQIKVKEKKHE